VIAFWHLMGAFTVAVAQTIASPDDLPRAVERHLHLPAPPPSRTSKQHLHEG
jgi:hypothetical protein